ncbi:ribosome-binding factor A [Buchnera aphidicola (Cinara tujafilina)]|uniref:Ribosome-binding factor A n=1 Tax=Buchnera aphidicola (Cinara tujafilina) TaxID=261317 RepID=F7WZG4_9GAMM|nr:30S ribosome-binding factor RbfA [Buchnera aphidicola]AEH39826.1 ribosome-binding factor A [Buchnera aphidicola (Cinara tujafilina)]
MLKKFSRSMRVEQNLYKEISVIIRNFLRDPRIHLGVTILAVQLSVDLHYAKVFFTSLQFQNKKKNEFLTHILQKSSGFIRYHLGKTIHLRIIPKLYFIYDDSFAKGMVISRILKENL